MTDKITHEEAEAIIDTAPKALLDRLPDNTETRSARRNLEVVSRYVHEVIDKTRHEPAD
jgi:hypothetical protein